MVVYIARPRGNARTMYVILRKARAVVTAGPIIFSNAVRGNNGGRIGHGVGG